ncbi:MAG: phytanoyl-CoA dioxygenase family protein [Geminicoccaceae bacterium]
MLDSVQTAAYREQGFVAPAFRFPDDRLAEMRAAVDRMIDAHPEWTDFCPQLLAQDPLWLEIASTPELLNVIAQLVGGDIVLWGSGYFGKPAGVGKETPWHQDGEYWPIKPLATITAWVALDAATSENGCLRVIPGSHRAGRLFEHGRDDGDHLTLNQVLGGDVFDEAEAVDVTLGPGEISLHDVYMIHGSLPNRSTKRRAGVTFRYMPASSQFDRALAAEQHARLGVPDISKRPLYLLRGQDKSGLNDYRTDRR